MFPEIGRGHPFDMQPDVETAVREVADRLLEQGAKAVVVVGSHARGSARPTSDIDLFAVGDGPRERFERVRDHVVSVHWWTPEAARQRMQSPPNAVVAVRAWRDAIVIEDPHGIASELRREAQAWSWDRLAAEADAWAVDELVGWAEYVRKLVASLEDGRELDACAFRAETALKLGAILAVERRLVEESENGLWESIAEAGGPEWRRALESALGRAGDDVETSARAAVELYALLAEGIRDRLDEREREIVEAALGVARRSLRAA
jgi:hypothetical protein